MSITTTRAVRFGACSASPATRRSANVRDKVDVLDNLRDYLLRWRRTALQLVVEEYRVPPGVMIEVCFGSGDAA
jgi:hypothetical protein